MEKTDCAATIPVDPQWSDMGSWQAVWEKNAQDDKQNSLGKDCYVENSSGCLVQSNGPVVGVVGLNDIVVVAEKDAVLVSHKDDAQNVKTLVAQLEANDAAVAQKHNGEDRPWGRFDSLDKGETHQVKRIRVSQGERLSLQYHHHRAEHWIVICGTATVTVDETVKNLVAGEQVYIPLGAVHRLENLTDEPVEIIEVQIGTYFGEDDIVRVEDVYGRPKAHPKYSGRAA